VDLGGEVQLNTSWKVHAIVVHLPQFLNRVKCSMARYSEQTSEAIHNKMKATLSRFCVSEEHPDHGKRLLKAVVEFSSERV
jgi:hypothetical protein